MTELATTVLELARSQGIMISTAESCTGGLIIAALTDIAGSSDVVDRGFITYSNDAKMDMLGVKPATLKEFGAVSEQTAKEMASGALLNSKSNLAVSVTGIAGPGGSERKPEGRVCFALAGDGLDVHAWTIEFGALGRSNVRKETAHYALTLLRDSLIAMK